MGQLIDMMDRNQQFTEQLPKDKQAIFIALAKEFEQNTQYLFLNQDELASTTQLGNPTLWQQFLMLPVINTYIRSQMAFLSQVSQRKTFQSLVSMAMSGNQQAAKQVQELSGIMNQQDTNRTIVLHHVPRPSQKEQTH